MSTSWSRAVAKLGGPQGAQCPGGYPHRGGASVYCPACIDPVAEAIEREDALLAREHAVAVREADIADKEAMFGSLEEGEEQLNKRARYLEVASDELQQMADHRFTKDEPERARRRIRDRLRRNR